MNKMEQRKAVWERLNSYREKNFGVKVAKPMYDRANGKRGEFRIEVTFNGYQFEAMTLFPEEWEHVKAAVEKHLSRRKQRKTQ